MAIRKKSAMEAAGDLVKYLKGDGDVSDNEIM
jgi:hypothetical protein